MTIRSDNPARPVENQPREKSGETPAKRFQLLLVLAAVLAGIYGVITWLSFRFGFDSSVTDRPIVLVLLLFGLAFAIYLISIQIASRTRHDPRMIWLIVGAAVVFRLTVFFSLPIQEVDIYRYLWDGIVTSQGVSPFKFSPDQVKSCRLNNDQDPELEKLAGLVERDPEIAKVLDRVQFGQLPTVYPSTSQFVFFGVTLITPQNSSVDARIQLMKLCLLAFDIGVLILVIKVLSICELPISLSIMYAWCPLVVKEVANSGHLDTIAMFLSTLAVYLLVRCSKDVSNSSQSAVTGRLVLIALILATAVGAKLYPIVLGPLVFLFSIKRFGFRSVVLPSVVFVVATFLLMLPMLPKQPTPVSQSSLQSSPALAVNIQLDQAQNDPSLGLKTFLKHWEMNDFLFMIGIENLKPAGHFPDNQKVWFSIVPDQPRMSLVEFVSNRFSVPVLETPFLITRMITSIIFVIVACWLAWRASRRLRVTDFCESAFLTLAWFWLLSPTQNPWYWLWALPLLPFVRNSLWVAVSGLVMVYYLRFWLGYHCADSNILNSGYQGTDFFDFVVTWMEFAPWLICLAASHVLRRPTGPAQ